MSHPHHRFCSHFHQMQSRDQDINLNRPNSRLLSSRTMRRESCQRNRACASLRKIPVVSRQPERMTTSARGSEISKRDLNNSELGRMRDERLHDVLPSRHHVTCRYIVLVQTKCSAMIICHGKLLQLLQYHLVLHVHCCPSHHHCGRLPLCKSGCRQSCTRYSGMPTDSKPDAYDNAASAKR